jgi:bacillolysin
VKKFLGILALLVLAVSVFIAIPKGAGASKNIFDKGTQDELERAKQISLDVLRNKAASRAIGNVDDFQVMKVEIDDLRMAHTRVRQTVGGIPVWEGEAIVHLKADGALSVVTDDMKDAIVVSTQPNYSADDALKIANSLYGGSAEITEKPKIDMWIYRGEDRDHLVYRIEVPRIDGSKDTAVPVDFIDAQTGERVFSYNNLQTGTGSSLYSGTVTINTSQSGSTFYMEDLTRKMGTFNMNSTGNETTGTGGTQSRYTDTDDVWNTTIQRAGVDAHYGARWTYDYYLNVHSRNGVDGAGGPGTTTAAANSGISLITSRVHFGSSGRYNNAFWYNNQMSYGDGDGVNFSPLTTIDICGHEMTHGVTERTANLTYQGESGALNESMSDVFGAMVELYSDGGTVSADTWKIGEDAYTPGTSGDALRYMDNPHLASNGGFTSNDDPDHYSERYTGTADYGGVHTNSGIANHVFYLAAAGGTHHLSGVTVTGMGTTDAARIWYRALTSYMTSGTNFSGARTATLNAASAIFGSTSAQYNTVAQAWCAAGIGSCVSGTPTPTPTPGGCGTELLTNGGFEGSAAPWVGSGTGYFYVNPGNYPHGGTGYIYFGVNNSVSGQSYQQVTIPSTACGTLTFWLNVTSNETTTTTQYDKLFVEVRNTAGTLLATLATYSNLNKGTAGVYSQKSLNMSAYKGQTVRVQFRSTTDSSLTSTFRVDDASLK